MEEVNPDVILEKVKRSEELGDTSQDLNIKDLIEDVINEFKVITGADKVLVVYSYIIKDIVLIRYNRKGSHGFKSHSVGDQSISYSDPKDDFLPYMKVLEKEFPIGVERRGRLTFY